MLAQLIHCVTHQILMLRYYSRAGPRVRVVLTATHAHTCMYTHTPLPVTPHYHHDHLLNATSTRTSETKSEGAQGKEGLLS